VYPPEIKAKFIVWKKKRVKENRICFQLNKKTENKIEKTTVQAILIFSPMEEYQCAYANALSIINR